MKKLKSIIVAILTIVILSACMLVGVSAASRLNVVSLPSEGNLNVQLFTVSNPNSEAVAFNWGCAQTSDSGSETVGAGASVTISVPDFGMNGRTIYVKYSQGGTNDIIYCGSTNRYYVYVEYRLTDGTLIYSENRAVSKADGSISVSAPAVYNDTYKLTSKATLGHVFNTSASISDRTLTFTYKEIVLEPYNIKAVYIDAETGASIGSVSYNVPVDGSVTVVPDAVYTAAGKAYELGAGQSAVTHYYGELTTSYTFYYTVIPENPAKPYTINIKYIDSATGAAFVSRNVTIAVGETVTCSIPATYVTGDSKQFNRIAGQPEKIVHAANNLTRSYSVLFVRNTALMSDPYDITIRYADAATGAIIESLSKNVIVNGTVTHEAPAELNVGGMVYTIAAGQPRTLSHSFGDIKTVYTVYYNDVNGEAAFPHEIILNYVDNVYNTVLYSTTITVPVRQMVYHSAPETFVSGGNEYILCAGQSKIAHDYSSARRTYVVFYRLEGETSARETSVGELPGVTIIDDAETVRVIAGSTAVTEAELTEINDAIDNSLAGNDGTDNEITIEDNEIPLAGGAINDTIRVENAMNSRNNSKLIVIAAGVICLGVLIAIAVAAVCTLKKKKSI